MAYNIVNLEKNLGNFNYMDYYKDLNFRDALVNTFENITNNYYKIGNVDVYGLELSISKGNFTLDNVFYTKPYPSANIYSIGYDYEFTYRINYKFNPYNYFRNGYIFHYSDLNNNDTSYLINGFPLSTNTQKLLVDGFTLKFYQDTNSTSNNFYINASGGSYYSDPLLTNYGDVNYYVNNYSNTYYSFSNLRDVNYNTYSANLSDNNLTINTLTTATGNVSNSLGGYFRDFNNTRTDVVVGFYNNPMGDWETSPNIYWRINNEKIPNLYNFLGATDYNGFNSSLLGLTPSNELKLSNDFWHIQYTQNNDRNPSFWTKSISIDQLDTLINTFGTDTGLMNLPDFKFIRSFSNVNTILNSNLTTTAQHNRLDNYGNNIRNTFLGSINNTDLIPFEFEKDQATFSNTFYTNSLANFDLRCSGLDYHMLGLDLAAQEMQLPRDVFNSTMAISFAGITIGGLATAIFLFRGLVGLIRSNK